MAEKAILEIAQQFGKLAKELIDTRMIVLFGSQARNSATAESDIDVAVIVDRIEGDFLDIETSLYRVRRDVDDRIEPVLIEFGTDPSGFLESILAYGVIVG